MQANRFKFYTCLQKIALEATLLEQSVHSILPLSSPPHRPMPVCTELHYADHCQQFIAEFSSMPLWIDFFSVPYFRKCCGHFFVPPVSGVKGTTSAQASQEFLWRCQFPISWKSFSGVPMLLELYLMHVIDIFGLGRNESLVLITIPSLP